MKVVTDEHRHVSRSAHAHDHGHAHDHDHGHAHSHEHDNRHRVVRPASLLRLGAEMRLVYAAGAIVLLWLLILGVLS